MNTKKLTEIALLTCIALIIHVLEAQIPPIVPIPGIKLGLSNIITLLALYRLRKREAVLVVAARILLSAAFSGSLSALIYSVSGSFLSLLVMMPLRAEVPPKYMFLPSILGAAAHNLGQILAAVLITRTPSLLLYLPILLLSGCIAGFFTGLCAAAVYTRLNKSNSAR